MLCHAMSLKAAAAAFSGHDKVVGEGIGRALEGKGDQLYDKARKFEKTANKRAEMLEGEARLKAQRLKEQRRRSVEIYFLRTHPLPWATT